MTVAYIVDENLRIVFGNEELWSRKPDLQYGEYCYRIFCGASGQCINCPLRKENQGNSVVFSQLYGEYVSLNSAEISYPGTKKSHIILMNTISDKEKTSFYNNRYPSEYNELAEHDGIFDKPGFFKAVENFEKFKSTLDLIRPEERVQLDEEISGQLQNGAYISAEYSIELADEYGNVYRVVGRADCMDAGKQWIDRWQDLSMRDRRQDDSQNVR